MWNANKIQQQIRAKQFEGTVLQVNMQGKNFTACTPQRMNEKSRPPTIKMEEAFRFIFRRYAAFSLLPSK